MTQIFAEDGKVIPVTLVDVSELVIAGIKNDERDGYNSVVLGKGKEKHPNKPLIGQYKAVGYVPMYIKEERVSAADLEGYVIGAEVKATVFEVGDKVHVTGVSKGKGFQGVVKRWGFKGGPKTHGQSNKHRSPGSIGSGTTPGRVYKGKKMGGHMGRDKVTVQNLKIMLVDEKNSIVAVKGAIPGAKGSYIIISKYKNYAS